MFSTIANLEVDHDFNPRLHDANNYAFNVDEMINLIIDNGWLAESVIYIGNYDEFKGKIIQGNKRVTALKIINDPAMINELKMYNKKPIFHITSETVKKIGNLTEEQKKEIFKNVKIETVTSIQQQKEILFELNEYFGHEKWSIHAKIKFLSQQSALYPGDLDIFAKLKLLINEYSEEVGYIYIISNIISYKTKDLRIAEEINKILKCNILGRSILSTQAIKIQINDNGLEAVAKNNNFEEIIMNIFEIFEKKNYLRVKEKESFILEAQELSDLLEFDSVKLADLKEKNSKYNKTKRPITDLINNIIKNHGKINYENFKSSEIEAAMEVTSKAVFSLLEVKYMYKSKVIFENLSFSLLLQNKRIFDSYLLLLIYKHFTLNEIQQLRQDNNFSIKGKCMICKKHNIDIFAGFLDNSLVTSIEDDFVSDNFVEILKAFDKFIVNNAFVHQLGINV